jgi:Ca2+-binding EF-hand superfamily protein
VADILFKKMDHDGNGQVSLEEFLFYFVESEVKIKTKLNETL